MSELISVIVPVYNVEQYLDRCVESIVNQTYKNLEIILVDDGSPDNCPQICDDWAKKDNRIKVIHKKNGGLSDARNAGLEIASGEYISFIDSDDWIELDFYETLANALDNGADIAECTTRLCDDDNNTISTRGFDEETILDGITATQTLLNEKGIMQTVWNKLYKRECINVKFEYGKYHEDNFWTWQIFLNAKYVFVSPKPMYNYVQRNNSIMSAGYSFKRLDALEAVYICYSELFDDDNYSKIVANKLINTSMFNLQSVEKHLQGEEKKKAEEFILSCIDDMAISKKLVESKWAKLFLIAPKSIAKIRAIIGTGF